ncbi:hypothetical protein K7432_013748 [Basidiobolus ranarum]|uniref:Membrane anchor Opy2 N-terminal domain-containing protein n=1 Tax=Basidiobolus ranarum TaxID=34480 RepID=A0ABR2VQU1_9FUNG
MFKTIAIFFLTLASASVFVSAQASTTVGILGNTPGCSICPRIQIGCFQGCGADQTCKIYPRTCKSCARAECVSNLKLSPQPKEECIICAQVFPACNINCKKGFKCQVQTQTCSACAYAACVVDDSVVLKPTPPKTKSPCHICPQFIPPCNLACKKGFICEIQKQTCETCSHPSCVPAKSSPYTHRPDPEYDTVEIIEEVNDVPDYLEVHNDMEILRDLDDYLDY